jgi:hypothetical protein
MGWIPPANMTRLRLKETALSSLLLECHDDCKKLLVTAFLYCLSGGREGTSLRSEVKNVSLTSKIEGED